MYRNLFTSDVTVQVLVAIAAAAAQISWLARESDSASIADLCIIAAVASTCSLAAGSFTRSPTQFLAALLERLQYCMVATYLIFLRLSLVSLKLLVVSVKILKHLILPGIAWAAYYFFKWDLVPDQIGCIGKLDDLASLILIAYLIARRHVKITFQKAAKAPVIATSFP